MIDLIIEIINCSYFDTKRCSMMLELGLMQDFDDDYSSTDIEKIKQAGSKDILDYATTKLDIMLMIKTKQHITEALVLKLKKQKHYQNLIKWVIELRIIARHKDNAGNILGYTIEEHKRRTFISKESAFSISNLITNAHLTKNGDYIANNGEHINTILGMNNKEENIYIIMLQNVPVLKINRHSGKVEIYNQNLVPFDIYLEDSYDADCANNIIVFNWWCGQRILSLDREHSKAILNSCNIKQAVTDKDRADIALKYKCLSLRDFYWVKKVEDKSKWENINLFDNSLSNSVVDISLLGKNLTLTNTRLIDSDLATDGLFPKAWYRQNNTFYLYKGDKNNSVNKEVRASEILRQLGFNVLQYRKTTFKDNTVSACKCFTNKNIGYITAGNLIQNYDLDTTYKEYDIMNLCDYLVGNRDRHQDNWGYIFNTKREIISFGEIFDFNHAFEASEKYACLPEQLLGRNITMLEVAKQVVKKYNIQLKLITEIDEYTHFVNNRIKLLQQYKT